MPTFILYRLARISLTTKLFCVDDTLPTVIYDHGFNNVILKDNALLIGLEFPELSESKIQLG